MCIFLLSQTGYLYYTSEDLVRSSWDCSSVTVLNIHQVPPKKVTSKYTIKSVHAYSKDIYLIKKISPRTKQSKLASNSKICLPLTSNCWDSRCVPPSLDAMNIFFLFLLNFFYFIFQHFFFPFPLSHMSLLSFKFLASFFINCYSMHNVYVYVYTYIYS